MGGSFQLFERSRLKICIDRTCFAPGASILQEMERAVLQSRKTAVVLSPNYLASQWAEFEQVLAQTLDPAARARRLIPVLLARCKLPPRVAMLNYLDFTSAADNETRLTTLVGAIRARRGRESGSSPVSKATVRRFLDYIRHRYEHLDFKGMGISDRVPLQLQLADMSRPAECTRGVARGGDVEPGSAHWRPADYERRRSCRAALERASARRWPAKRVTTA